MAAFPALVVQEGEAHGAALVKRLWPSNSRCLGGSIGDVTMFYTSNEKDMQCKISVLSDFVLLLTSISLKLLSNGMVISNLLNF